jgi:HD-like signal output (HDOD) protein
LRADVETYSQVLEKRGEDELLRWEHEMFGYNHAQVGALVAQGWRLPEGICQSILHHHNASQTIQSLFISHLVNIADIVANYNGYGLRLEDEAAFINSESALLLHLTTENLHTAWENIQVNLEEVTGSF